MPRKLSLLVLTALVLVPALALAQGAPPDPSADPVGLLVQAIHSKAWPVVVAVLVGGTVTLLKQGYLGQWVASQVPASERALLATALSVFGMWASEVQTGIAWDAALRDACIAAFTAIVGHKAIVEGVFGGRELLPKKVAAPGGPAGGAGGGLVGSLVRTVGCGVIALMVAGCAGGLQPLPPKAITVTALEAKDAICALSKLGEAFAQIMQECGLLADQAQALMDLIGAAQAAGVSVTVSDGVVHIVEHIGATSAASDAEGRLVAQLKAYGVRYDVTTVTATKGAP